MKRVSTKPGNAGMAEVNELLGHRATITNKVSKNDNSLKTIDIEKSVKTLFNHTQMDNENYIWIYVYE